VHVHSQLCIHTLLPIPISAQSPTGAPPPDHHHQDPQPLIPERVLACPSYQRERATTRTPHDLTINSAPAANYPRPHPTPHLELQVNQGTLLPMPHHSTLNHAYLNKGLPDGLIAVGLTTRFRHKFVSRSSFASCCSWGGGGGSVFCAIEIGRCQTAGDVRARARAPLPISLILSPPTFPFSPPPPLPAPP
jgi:hypothetical protein